MVELTGIMAEEAAEVLQDLHHGIDVLKSVVTASHDLDLKLSSIDVVIQHVVMEYPSKVADIFE